MNNALIKRGLLLELSADICDLTSSFSPSDNHGIGDYYTGLINVQEILLGYMSELVLELDKQVRGEQEE